MPENQHRRESTTDPKPLLKEGSTEKSIKRFEENFRKYREVFEYLRDK